MAISGWGVFLIILVIVAVGAAAGYFAFSHYRARKLGLPPPNLNPFNRSQLDQPYRGPAPAPGGVKGWLQDKWSSLRNPRTAGGAYEGTSYRGARQSVGDRRGFGPLDPDEAWDSRVDNEAGGYYEEQELDNHGPYAGGGYGEIGVGGIEEGRGRSRSRQRELDTRYDEEVHGGQSHSNPFGDHAEESNASLRTVSPRPHVETAAQTPGGHGEYSKGQHGLSSSGSADNSPIERRSVFREDM